MIFQLNPTFTSEFSLRLISNDDALSHTHTVASATTKKMNKFREKKSFSISSYSSLKFRDAFAREWVMMSECPTFWGWYYLYFISYHNNIQLIRYGVDIRAIHTLQKFFFSFVVVYFLTPSSSYSTRNSCFSFIWVWWKLCDIFKFIAISEHVMNFK